jgi:8-amino-3,8-dideoxy-alpha-D-manno-octulosonate transaminase
MSERLAIEGGTPVRATPLRGGFHGSAVMDAAEQDAVVNVLNKKRLFRFLANGEAESEAAQIEAWYGQRLGRKHCLAVNGGTSALIAALFGIDAGPGDEVIIPAYTYVATAAAVIAAGAVPVLCEIDRSLNMDPLDLERKITPQTKAVIPVHMRGVPARIDAITEVARRHGLSVVEDVAQANGGQFRGKPLGSFGDVGCYSFQQYKIITSGEGGLVATDDPMIYDRTRMQHDCAARFWEGTGSSDAYPYVISGENYRISELGAALVWAQRERLDTIIGHCRGIKGHVIEGLSDIAGIELQDVPDPGGDCGITLALFLPNAASAKAFAAALRAENIGCGTVYDNSIPDRHIYANWPFMVSGLAEDRRAPWKSPFYHGQVKGYRRDACPRSIELLGRALVLSIDQTFTAEDADSIVAGMRKVAAALL